MTVYYIDPANGSNDNSGTSESDAFADFTPVENNGSHELQAGDTVKVRGTDTVQGTIDLFNFSGSGDARIVIEAYQDESPVIDANGATDAINMSGSQYVTLRGLEIKNATRDGIRIRASAGQTGEHNVIEDCDVHRCGTNGIACLQGARQNTVRNCYLHHNKSSGNGDGMTVQNEAREQLIEDCVFAYNADDGLDCIDNDGNYGSTIRGCVAHNNGQDGDGVGFKLGRWDTSKNSYPTGGHYVERCIAHSNAGIGFRVTGESANTVYHCTSWNNEWSSYRIKNAAHELRNNLSWNNGGLYRDGQQDDAYNSWNLDIGDPLFVSTDPASSDFLRLSSDSPAINAGIELGLGFGGGTSPDLGMYQTTAAAGPTLNVYDGSSFGSPTTVRYYDGTQWQSPTVKVSDGSQFNTVD